MGAGTDDVGLDTGDTEVGKGATGCDTGASPGAPITAPCISVCLMPTVDGLAFALLLNPLVSASAAGPEVLPLHRLCAPQSRLGSW